MKYLASKIEELKGRLAELPAAETSQRTVTKQAAIAMLAAEIRTLRSRDYTFEHVAEKLLTEGGLKISVATLKTYLRRAAGRSRPGRRKAGGTPTEAAPASTREPARPPSGLTARKTSTTATGGGGGFPTLNDTDEI